MQQDIVLFIQHNLLLVLALVIVLLLLIIFEFIKQKRGALRLSPSKAVHLMNHADAVIVDIRNPEAFAKGHPVGAISLPLTELNEKQKRLEKYKSKSIIVVCNTGAEAQRAAALLKKLGFNANVLAGGIRAWQDAGIPLVKE